MNNTCERDLSNAGTRYGRKYNVKILLCNLLLLSFSYRGSRSGFSSRLGRRIPVNKSLLRSYKRSASCRLMMLYYQQRCQPVLGCQNLSIDRIFLLTKCFCIISRKNIPKSTLTFNDELFLVGHTDIHIAALYGGIVTKGFSLFHIRQSQESERPLKSVTSTYSSSS